MSISSIAPPEPEVKTAPTESPVTDDILEALLSKIAPPAESPHNLRMMIYSNFGAGKTTLLGQVPNNLIMDTEKGKTVLTAMDLAKGVQVIPFVSFYQAEMLVDRLGKNVPQLDWVETLSIDTVSFLHKKGLEEVTEREFENNPVLNNRYVAETEHHTENNEHIRRLVSNAVSLERNLIITAHARSIEPKNGPTKIFPDFSEKLANVLGGMMDIVGYLYVTELDGEMKRVLMVHTNGNIACKTRISGMPDQIVDPTWDKIWAYFEAHNAKGKQKK